MADAKKSRPTSSRPRKAKSSHPQTGEDDAGKLYKSGTVYNILFDHVFRIGRKTAIQMLDLKPGDRVLEVGVGTGLSLKYFPAGISLTGIDLSPDMLKEARAMAVKLGREDVELLEMDATKLSFPDGSFDKVMATHVLSAVPDAQRAFDEIKRVCVPGGIISIANRFQSRASVMRAAEKRLTPLTRKLGFIMDLSLDMFTEDPELSVTADRKVKMPGAWHVLRLVKQPGRVGRVL